MGIISVHIHPPTREFTQGLRRSLEAMAGSLKAEASYLRIRPIEDLLLDMDNAGIEKSVLLPLDVRYKLGEHVPNDHVAKLVREHPDRLVGFASVDPHMGAQAVADLERWVSEFGLRGLKLDGTKQDFCPSDRMVYPLYEKCVELDIPATFHAGRSPGFPIKYGNPEYIDQVAYDFPELRINIAHFAWPWYELCLAIAWDRPNVFFDIGGWRPRHIPPRVIEFTNTVLQDKALFSHDFPVVDTARFMREFHELPLRPEVKKKMMEDNPRHFLKL